MQILNQFFCKKDSLYCCYKCAKFSSTCEVIFIFSCILSSVLWDNFLWISLYYLSNVISVETCKRNIHELPSQPNRPNGKGFLRSRSLERDLNEKLYLNRKPNVERESNIKQTNRRAFSKMANFSIDKRMKDRCSLLLSF